MILGNPIDQSSNKENIVEDTFTSYGAGKTAMNKRKERKQEELGGSSDLIMVVKHESLRLLGSEAEADVEVVCEGGNVCQSHVQVTLT